MPLMDDEFGSFEEEFAATGFPDEDDDSFDDDEDDFDDDTFDDDDSDEI